jgi:class 3 adenylate cyclase
MQVLSELQLNLRLGASERAAVVAQEFEGCTFLFAKLVGLRHLVESADPRWLLELLQTTFDRFDTLAETFSVQRVRKTVNESYMVAAGLPCSTLLRSPVDRALATAGFGLALCGVMDVLNAQMAQRMAGGKGGKRRAGGGGGGGGGGSAPPTLAVQVGINSGSAIAGVIGHRRIQYDLVGDAVNTAARMCSYGAPGRVHLSAATYEHLVPHYLATSRGPLQVCTRAPAVTPPCHRCAAAPLHRCASAPLRRCTSAPLCHLYLCTSAPLRLCTSAPPAPLRSCTPAPLPAADQGQGAHDNLLP